MRSPRLAVAATLLLLAGCVEHAPAPKPAPPPPAPAPPPPAAADWRDLPLAPGTWRYAADVQGSTARFGSGEAPPLVLRCTLSSRTVTIFRAGASGALTIRTSYGERAIAGGAAGAPLPASDPLLDQIAFSRGRFSVAAPGLPLLVVPAWAEPGRVVEDCRP